jgi:hypothetical protein
VSIYAGLAESVKTNYVAFIQGGQKAMKLSETSEIPHCAERAE